ncbi:MAG: diguanylate cyclase [Alteromonadales bacterium]|nr:diguanylate cyclase [Alteromonadales bacterium]
MTKKPILIDGYCCDISLSIGICYSREEHETWVDILKDADAAMYHAKEKGGGQYQIYEKS